MENLGTLHTVAQIAIALIGFSGIVIVFGERSAAKWTAEEAMRLYALLAPSFTALLCSFVPILLATEVTSTEVVWRLSNAVLGALHLANLGWFLINTWGAKATLGQKINGAVGFGVIAAHALAALALIPWFEFVFIFGLLQQLYIGVHNFLLLFRPEVTGTA
jgi:hypothetical protein